MSGPNNVHPLELSSDSFATMVRMVTDRLARHLGTLEEQPMHRNKGAEKKARALRELLPEAASDLESVVGHIFDRILPMGLNTASPGYLAYIPGGGLPQAAVADLITGTVNRFVNVWVAAPGLAEVESSVVRWFGQIVGLPESGSGGVLTTGGSMANLIALVAARRDRLPEDFLKGVLYCSTETHHSVTKAAIIAGFPERNVRAIPTDSSHALSIEHLSCSIKSDRDQGLIPFCVVGNAGTTTTGAVDPLAGIAKVASEQRLWFHVDGAFGGFFCLTERGRDALRGIEQADSVTLDPHKGLFLPYGTGSLIVRDKSTLKKAFSVTAAYLPTMQSADDLVDFCELSPELSRESRGLRVYLPMKLHGAEAFRAALNEKLDLARYAADAIGAFESVVMTSKPHLSLFTFRVEPTSRCLGVEQLNLLQSRIIHLVNQQQRVLLTSGLVANQVVIRFCVLSFRTHQRHIDRGIEDIGKAIQTALSE